MPNVLTDSSTVTCGHSGKVTTSGNGKLTVNGNPVLLKSGVAGKAVSHCATAPASEPSGPIAKPCTTVSSVTAGEATKLTIAGNPVLIDTLTGQTDGMVAKKTPQDLLSATANQTKLTTV